MADPIIYSPRWNWDGDRIVPETIVPSGRPVAPEVTIPANLKNRPCFRFRSALPHHNEIAVDEFPKQMTKADNKIQKLYDPPTYARQFTYWYNTARNHILEVFSESWCLERDGACCRARPPKRSNRSLKRAPEACL